MAEATCRRELELEIPAEDVSKATERVAKEIARVARVPGFRPGKAPVSLIKRRFADDIKGEVLQSLVPRARLWRSASERRQTARDCRLHCGQTRGGNSACDVQPGTGRPEKRLSRGGRSRNDRRSPQVP